MIEINNAMDLHSISVFSLSFDLILILRRIISFVLRLLFNEIFNIVDGERELEHELKNVQHCAVEIHSTELEECHFNLLPIRHLFIGQFKHTHKYAREYTCASQFPMNGHSISY